MLRTVSFSDKRVADRVNSKFVAAWINRGPGFMNTEFWTESGIVQSNYEAYPTKNICTFFLSPEGKVFFYAAGSYSPEFFLKILDTAWSLRTALFDDRMSVKSGGLAEATRIHEDKADAFQDAKEKAQRANQEPDGWRTLMGNQRGGNYRGLKHVHGPSCISSLKDGYDYLSALHRLWATQVDLPAFPDVQYKYLYGNEFTEETPESPKIARPDPSNPPGSKPVPSTPRLNPVETQRLNDIYGIGLFGQKSNDR